MNKSPVEIAKQTIRKDDGFRVPCSEENAIILAQEVLRLTKNLGTLTETYALNYRAYEKQSEALKEAEEAMSMGAFHHDACPWLRGEQCVCAKQKVTDWLNKYGSKEKK